jgi:hypothetical protein
MSEGELMGRNEYARHRGCAPNAVTKAVASGRIAKAVLWSQHGTIAAIRWRLADELWAANTDREQQRRALLGLARQRLTAAARADPVQTSVLPDLAYEAAHESALLRLPAALREVGVSDTARDHVLAAIVAAFTRELLARGVSPGDCEKVSASLRSMIAQEARALGTWTASD